MKTNILVLKIALFVLLLLWNVVDLTAQCPMCKIGAEANLKSGGSAAMGLNTGILYMLSMPYLLVATLGIIWYKNRRQDGEEILLS